MLRLAEQRTRSQRPHSRRTSRDIAPSIAFALFVAWAVAVASSHVSGLADLFGPALPFLRRVGLIGLSLAAFLGWGRALLGFALGPHVERLRPEERTLFEVGSGAWVVMLLILAAGILGFLGPLAAWTVVLVPIPYLAISVVRRLPRVGTGDGMRSSLALSLLLLAAAMVFVENQAPAVSQDALVYHLAVPQRFIEEGRIRFVESNFYSAFPFNVEMLFTLGLLLDGEELAKSYHFLFWVGSVAAVALLARRVLASHSHDQGDPALRREGAGVAAAALFGTVPTAALIAGWAYVDLAVVFFTTGSVLALLAMGEARCGTPQACEADHRSESRALVLAAIFAAAAAGSKYTAGIQGLLLVAFAALRGYRRGERASRIFRSASIVAAIVGIGIGPWLAKNWIETGNPLFPFAYGIFGSEYWDASRAATLSQSLAEWGGSQGGLAAFLLPWDVTVNGRFFSPAHFDGVIGWAFLAGLPLIFIVSRRGAGKLVAAFALAHLGSWIVTTHQVRFALPALALLAALLGAGAASLSSRLHARVGWSLMQTAIACNVLIIAIHFAAHRPLGVVLGQETRERFLEREVPGGDWAVFHYIEERLPRDARIFFASCGGPGFLCKRPYHADAFFENFTLVRWLDDARDVEELRAKFREGGFTHVLLRPETVFDPSGRKSEIPLAGQLELAEFLNRYAALETQKAGTFLYRLRTD